VIHTCQKVIQLEEGGEDECGGIAHHQVTVKSKTTKAKIWLCDYHKRQRNFEFMHARNPQAIVNCTMKNCTIPEHRHSA
jgi:hypothetical protein